MLTITTVAPNPGEKVSSSLFGDTAVTDLTALAAVANELSNTKIFSSLGGCTLGTVSATYVNVTNASRSYTKLGSGAGTTLLVATFTSCWVTVANTQPKFGINVNSVDTDATTMLVSGASTHQAMPPGIALITGLAAGTYTVQLRALRVSGTGQINIDTGDSVTMLIAEVPQ